MPFFVFPSITAPLELCSFPGWNGWFCSMIVKIIDQLVAVISAVCKYTASLQRNMLQQGYRKINIIALSLADHNKKRISIGIYRCMDFCTGSSTTMSNFIGLPPFGAPALCGYAWTIEASIDNASNSASSFSTRKILSRIPSSIHFRKRL